MCVCVTVCHTYLDVYGGSVKTLKWELEVVVSCLTEYWEWKSNPWRVVPALDHWAVFPALSSHPSSTKKHLMATPALTALHRSHGVIIDSSLQKLCLLQTVNSLGQTACEVHLFSVTFILGIPCTRWFKYKSCTDSIIVKYIVFW